MVAKSFCASTVITSQARVHVQTVIVERSFDAVAIFKSGIAAAGL